MVGFLNEMCGFAFRCRCFPPGAWCKCTRIMGFSPTLCDARRQSLGLKFRVERLFYLSSVVVRDETFRHDSPGRCECSEGLDAFGSKQASMSTDVSKLVPVLHTAPIAVER